jgi:hypothetical protein
LLSSTKSPIKQKNFHLCLMKFAKMRKKLSLLKNLGSGVSGQCTLMTALSFSSREPLTSTDLCGNGTPINGMPAPRRKHRLGQFMMTWQRLSMAMLGTSFNHQPGSAHTVHGIHTHRLAQEPHGSSCGWAGSFRLWPRHHGILLIKDSRIRAVIPSSF